MKEQIYQGLKVLGKMHEHDFENNSLFAVAILTIPFQLL